MLKKSKSKAKPADSLLKASKKDEIELTEQELKEVSGGFLKITMTDVQVSTYQTGGGEKK